MSPKKSLLCCLGALALTTVSVLAQPCSLSIPQPNIGTNIASVEPAWWNFDFSAADNASYLSNYVVVDNAGIAPGAYLSWCIDVNDVFPGNPTVNTDVQFFSSCDLNLDTELETELPISYPAGVYVSPEIWRQINYLLNHKGGAYFYNVQLAIWTLIGIPIDPSLLSGPNVPPNYPPYDLTIVDALVAAAQANADTWTPVCGDVTAAIEAIDGVTPRDQLIIIEVPTPPSVNAPGGNLGCNVTDIPAAILATVTATPGSTISITPVGAPTTTGCVVSQQYEITATCSGGASGSVTVTYSWTIDATGPIFSVGGTPVSTPLPPLSFYCYEDFLAYSNSLVVTATDSCSDSPVPAPVVCSHSESNPHASCNNTINLSWCAYNSCGVEGTLTQTITVNNTNKPVLSVPPGYAYGCNPPTVTNSTTIAGAITASSFCGDTPSIHISSVDSLTGCAASRVFTVTATDACGNSATQHVTYTWTTNTTPPTLSGVPTGRNLGCNPANLPTIGSIKALVTATGNCGIGTTVTVTTPGPTGTCTVTQTFNISATDTCGNTAGASVTYTWTSDVVAPMITCPGNVNITNTTGGVAACSVTQGGWGAPPHGGNPGAILLANFSTVYPGGSVSIGSSSGYTLKFTSPSNIQAFLPQGGTPNALTTSAVNPTSSSAGVFAGQVLALQLNVDFGAKGVGLGTPIGALVYDNPGAPLSGDTVAQILAVANTVLGGGPVPSGMTISSLNDLCDNLNQSFDGCVPDGFATTMLSGGAPDLTPPPPSQTGYATATDNCTNNPIITYSDTAVPGSCPGSEVITRTWTATDGCGNSSTCAQMIYINCPPPPALSLTCSGGSGQINTPFSTSLVAEGGTGPYTFMIVSGALPHGVTLNASTGVISGTPTVSGSFTFTAEVTDSSGATALSTCASGCGSGGCVITISAIPLTLGCAGGSGQVGVPYSASLSFSGGTAPYTFSIISGSLPPGLTLISNLISGTPITAGTFSFTAQVKDANGLTASESSPCEIVIGPGSGIIGGDAATIGFWHNKNGQALIDAVNGSSSSKSLGNWLASNFPYLYGAHSANNMANQPNTAVAALFLNYFGVTGAKTQAQILAGALAVYVTDSSLAGGTYGSGYGFNISATGTGAKTYNVQSNGSGIGLQNNTSYTVLQLLQQANLDAKNGVFNADATYLNAVFDGINSTGDINN